MVTLTSLPSNILLNICAFSDATDCARIAQVCKCLHDVTKCCSSYNYTFRVDAPTHPTWKLVRFLITNSESNLGGLFKKISVTWERRQCLNRKTWTKRWKWTHEEICRIKEIGKVWRLGTQMVGAIIMGINSEALLPFLLCLTPNVETLDMGDVEPILLENNDQPGRNTSAVFGGDSPLDYLVNLLGDTGEEDPNEQRYMDDTQLEDKGMRQAYSMLWSKLESRLIPDSGTLWFHRYLDSVDLGGCEWLPGLANVRNFVHGFSNPSEIMNKGGIRRWSARYLGPIFFFPKIQTMRISFIGEPLRRITEILGKVPTFKSTVRHLTISESIIPPADYFLIARITNALECLHIDGIHDNPRRLEDAFLACNENCLEENEILVIGRRGKVRSGVEDVTPADQWLTNLNLSLEDLRLSHVRRQSRLDAKRSRTAPQLSLWKMFYPSPISYSFISYLTVRDMVLILSCSKALTASLLNDSEHGHIFRNLSLNELSLPLHRIPGELFYPRPKHQISFPDTIGMERNAVVSFLSRIQPSWERIKYLNLDTSTLPRGFLTSTVGLMESLVELSVRYCSGLGSGELYTVYANEGHQNTNLKKLKFWGLDRKNDRVEMGYNFEKILELGVWYETDVVICGRIHDFGVVDQECRELCEKKEWECDNCGGRELNICIKGARRRTCEGCELFYCEECHPKAEALDLDEFDEDVEEVSDFDALNNGKGQYSTLITRNQTLGELRYVQCHQSSDPKRLKRHWYIEEKCSPFEWKHHFHKSCFLKYTNSEFDSCSDCKRWICPGTEQIECIECSDIMPICSTGDWNYWGRCVECEKPLCCGVEYRGEPACRKCVREAHDY